ncbi:MAG: FHA domain-containing protein [Anaerolineales bacterium]|nr:FHA domain-containing protein [Anaerolineales bacterium]
MIQCKECGADQYEGTLFCSECGRFLLDAPPKTTATLPFTQFGQLPSPPPLVQETIALESGPRNVTFVIPSGRRRIKLALSGEMFVGRSDGATGFEPALDLTEFDAAAHGVSRQHAKIQLTNRGVVLVDLDSTNGTYLNNFRLSANQPYLVNNGDEILLGDLLIHMFING